MSEKEIPIFFTIDESYVPFLGTALASMKENASPEYSYRVIILEQDVSGKSRERLRTIEEPGFSLEFVRMGAMPREITDREENRLRCDYFTLTIYYRLFIADMFPQYDKAVYIDSDVIVAGDISELYGIKMGDCLIGACPDDSIADVPELVRYTQEAVGMEAGTYINSGVLLLNLKAMRKSGLGRHFLSLLDQYHFDCVAPDQDYLNAMCKGKIHYLDKRWDAMPVRGKGTLEDPRIIHFNLFEKPWCYSEVGYEEYFWHYARQSVFYPDIRAVRENYTERQRAADREHMRLLIEKASAIPKAEVTFRKMKERGVRIEL